MSVATWLGFSIGTDSSPELPNIFPLPIAKLAFIETDVINIFSKILTDVVERTAGLTKDQAPLLWDNCLKSESNDGLITMLAKAMSGKQDLFLVYDAALKVVRRATSQEQAQIKKDYETSAESSVGLFISFKNYYRTDMIKLYAALEYCTIGSLNKSMNLSNALQFKMDSLRATTGLSDSAAVKAQALAIATALGLGKDVLLDGKDVIDTAKPDLTTVKESIMFLDSKRAFYLGLPTAYINGEQTGGLGTSGENDTKAIERGLKNYYFAIIKPVVEALFGINLTYKTQDFRQIAQALEAVKTFDLVSENYITWENKKRIVEGLLDIDEDDNQIDEPIEDEATFTMEIPGAPPVNEDPQG